MIVKKKPKYAVIRKMMSSSNEKRISLVRVCNYPPSSSNPPLEIMSREKVARKIQSGILFITMLENKGELVDGEYLHPIVQSGDIFISTNPNELTGDNLKNLPDFSDFEIADVMELVAETAEKLER